MSEKTLRPPVLAADEIHVWQADLTPSPERLADLAAALAADERERAARFRFPEHRDHFIAGRGLLRELLGAYLNRPAVALRFAHGPRGKPMLAGEEAGAGLYFNLAHSGGRALYAVAHREVGVDLECLDRVVSDAAVAERVCTPREWAAFQALPAERLREAFFSCWTRKEAIAKALGGGLASGLGRPGGLLPGRWVAGRSGQSAGCGEPGMERVEPPAGFRLDRQPWRRKARIGAGKADAGPEKQRRPAALVGWRGARTTNGR